MNVGSKKREDWEKDEYRLALLSIWRSTGVKNADIAKQMGVTYKTLKEWIRESPAIKEALETGKAELVKKLAGAMAQRAFGIEYEEVKTTVLGDVRKGSKVVENQQTVKIEKVTKRYPPDVGALCFMLTNLDPDNWKNRRNTDANVTGALPVVITGSDDLED